MLAAGQANGLPKLELFGGCSASSALVAPLAVLAALEVTAVDQCPLLPQVLWPYLLEFLTPVRFTEALTPLCRSLVHLALKRQEAGADILLVQYNAHSTQT